MIPEYIAKLCSVKMEYQKVAALERELAGLLSRHIGIDVSIVNQASDGIRVDIDGGFSGLTQLTENTLTKILSLPRKEAIQYIRDRSI